MDVSDVLRNLSPEEVERIEVIMRGVAHSGRAREELHTWCHAHGIADPNAVIRWYRERDSWASPSRP